MNSKGFRPYVQSSKYIVRGCLGTQRKLYEGPFIPPKRKVWLDDFWKIRITKCSTFVLGPLLKVSLTTLLVEPVVYPCFFCSFLIPAWDKRKKTAISTSSTCWIWLIFAHFATWHCRIRLGNMLWGLLQYCGKNLKGLFTIFLEKSEFKEL